MERKESWRDEYMKTICAFANTSGGALEIGKKDNGEIIGVANTKKLLEDIPNKIKNAMAIIVDVSVRESDGLQYISVAVGAYPFPISYHGVYYIRLYAPAAQPRNLPEARLTNLCSANRAKHGTGFPFPM